MYIFNLGKLEKDWNCRFIMARLPLNTNAYGRKKRRQYNWACSFLDISIICIQKGSKLDLIISECLIKSNTY